MSKFDSELIKGYAVLVESPGGDQEIPLSNAGGGSPASGGQAQMPTMPQGMPQQPQAPPEEEESHDSETPEGETMLIDLVKKALFIDPKELNMSLADKSLLAKQVTPKNAAKVAETLKRIVNDYELPQMPN